MADSKNDPPRTAALVASPESVEIALAVGSTFGSFPSSISSVVRSLMLDHLKGAKTQRASILFKISRLFRAPKIQAAFYYAAKLFKPEQFAALEYFGPEELVDLFGPDEIAALLSLVCASRKAKSLCKPDEWKYIFPPIQTQANISAFFGLKVPRIGLASSILISTLPCIALAAFHKRDEAGFKEYRRHLKAKNLVLDHDFERNKWECDSIQIAAKLAQSLGFGLSMSEAFMNTLSMLLDDSEEVLIDNLRLPVAYCWTSSLNSRSAAPEELDEERLAELWPAQDDITFLIEKSEALKAQNPENDWLDKSKADLSPELAPKLFSKRATKKTFEQEQGDQQRSDITYSGLLPELKAMISEEEFNSMSYEEKRQLVPEAAQ